jgi:hypothetical protein
MTDIAFVRSDIATAQPAPRNQSGVVAWLRKNLFASVRTPSSPSSRCCSCCGSSPRSTAS